MAIDKDELLREASCFLCAGISTADALIIALLQRIAEGSCGPDTTCEGLSGTGSPVGAQTPDFVDQLYHDTAADEYWRSTGLTNADWTQIVGAPSGVDLFSYNNDTGTDFSSTLLTEFTGDFWITGASNGSDLTSVSFPNLTTVGGFFDLDAHPDLATLDLTSLETVGDGSSGIFLGSLDSLPAVNLPALITNAGSFTVQGMPAMITLNIPNLVTITGNVDCSLNTVLVTVDCSSWVPTNGTTILFTDGALNESSVDLILARCVANAAFVSGTVALNGGTNAPPGVQGAADVLVLQGRGVTVTTN